MILLLTDNQRALNGGYYYMPETKARIIDRGLRFSQLHCETSFCAPDRACIFTGLYTRNHKVHPNSTDVYIANMVNGHLSAGRFYGPWEYEARGRGRMYARCKYIKAAIFGGGIIGPLLQFSFYRDAARTIPIRHDLDSNDKLLFWEFATTDTLGNPLLAGLKDAADGFKVASLDTAHPDFLLTYSGASVPDLGFTSGAGISVDCIKEENWMFSSGSIAPFLHNPVDMLGNPIVQPWGKIKTLMIGKYENGYAKSNTQNIPAFDYFGTPQEPWQRIPACWDSWYGLIGDQTTQNDPPDYGGDPGDPFHTASCEGSSLTDWGDTSTVGRFYNDGFSYLSYDQKPTAVVYTAAGAASTLKITCPQTHLLVDSDIGTALARVSIRGASPSTYNSDFWYVASIQDANTFTINLGADLGAPTFGPNAKIRPFTLHRNGVYLKKAIQFMDSLDAGDAFYIHFNLNGPGDPESAGNSAPVHWQGSVPDQDFMRYNDIAGAVPPNLEPYIVSATYNTPTAGKTRFTFRSGIDAKIGINEDFRLHNQVGNVYPSGSAVLTPSAIDTVAGNWLEVTGDFHTYVGYVCVSVGAANSPRGMKQWVDSNESNAGIDEIIGLLDDYLIAKGWAESTTIILTSDNGMAIGEHDAADLITDWEESTHLGLYMRHPTLPPGDIDISVHLIDLVPTILDLFGLTTHHAHRTKDGRSILRLMNGPSDPYWDRVVLLNNTNNGCVTSARMKYMQGRDTLYDLNVDPYEMNDLANASAEYRALADSLNARTDALVDCQDETCRNA